MASERGFGDDGTKATRFCQSDHGNDQMNEQDEQVVHPGNSINTSKSRRIQAKLAIRHGQARRGKPQSQAKEEATGHRASARPYQVFDSAAGLPASGQGLEFFRVNYNISQH